MLKLLKTYYGIQPMSADENGLPTNAESEHAQARALIVSDKSDFYSHWNAKESLEDFKYVPNI